MLQLVSSLEGAKGDYLWVRQISSLVHRDGMIRQGNLSNPATPPPTLLRLFISMMLKVW